MKDIVFKWYYIKDGDFPPEKEKIHFDDNNDITHLGWFVKKDQFDRDNMFISTEGGFFPLEKVIAWIPIQKREIGHVASKVQCSLCSFYWIAVRPNGVEKLECPNCKNVCSYEDILKII